MTNSEAELLIREYEELELPDYDNKISVDKTDLIEWLSICDSIIDLLVRYKVSSIFPFNLCYQTLIALKDSINNYKISTNN